MRFYSIDITNPKTGKPVLPSSLKGRRITSLLDNGNYNPSALNIEFDIPEFLANAPDSNAWVRIWGLSLQDIMVPDVNDMLIKISLGMSKGLPLANPSQQGVVLDGQIFQAYGNWVGTDMTLDLQFVPASGSNTDLKNLTFSWRAGTSLESMIRQTLTTAFPTRKQIIQISQKLVLPNSEAGYYASLIQFAQYVEGISKAIIGGTAYPGIKISDDGTTIKVWDSTVAPPDDQIKTIDFKDMIGQPTWLAPGVISVKLVLRGDLSLGQIIKMPKSLITTTGAAFLRFQDKSAQTGKFMISQIHHYGNFRQPDAASWNTTIQANPQA